MKSTVSKAKLEHELAVARAAVLAAEADLALAKRARDRLVVKLRRHPDRPSARAVGELAGVSAPWVLKLEEGAG